MYHKTMEYRIFNVFNTCLLVALAILCIIPRFMCWRFRSAPKPPPTPVWWDYGRSIFRWRLTRKRLITRRFALDLDLHCAYRIRNGSNACRNVPGRVPAVQGEPRLPRPQYLFLAVCVQHGV